jgi:hypothetical protein
MRTSAYKENAANVTDEDARVCQGKLFVQLSDIYNYCSNEVICRYLIEILPDFAYDE